MGILTYTCICINRVVTPAGLKDMEYLQKLSLIVMEGSASSKKRKRQTAADWPREYPDLSNEVPEDGGLNDDELISIGLDWTHTIKTRWVAAPYI